MVRPGVRRPEARGALPDRGRRRRDAHRVCPARALRAHLGDLRRGELGHRSRRADGRGRALDRGARRPHRRALGEVRCGRWRDRLGARLPRPGAFPGRSRGRGARRRDDVDDVAGGADLLSEGVGGLGPRVHRCGSARGRGKCGGGAHAGRRELERTAEEAAAHGLLGARAPRGVSKKPQPTASTGGGGWEGKEGSSDVSSTKVSRWASHSKSSTCPRS